jgi:hypothetical protein
MRATVPTKPYRLVTLIVEVTDEPGGNARLSGLAEIA